MTLKQSFVSAVAFIALASFAEAADLRPIVKAPPAEPQQATGYVEIYGGWAGTRATESFCDFGDCDTETFRLNGWALGGAGRANYWVSREMSVQVDAQAEGTSYDVSGESGRFSNHSYLVGGHFSWRNPQQYLFGLFAVAGDAGGSTSFIGSQRHGVIGGEAQWYWNQFTLYAQGGYDSTLGNASFGIDSIHAWFIRGTGRYFVNPNFLFEGTVAYANGDIDFNFGLPSLGFETWTWQAKAEWRFPTAPFSVFAKYQGSETTIDTGVPFFFGFNKATNHRVLVGLKLNMGDRTLQETDRAGATLDIIDPLSNPTSPLMFGTAGVVN